MNAPRLPVGAGGAHVGHASFIGTLTHWLLLSMSLTHARLWAQVVLMSATLNAALFADYFGGCPVVQIPGRTHPVNALFLEHALTATGYVLEDGSEFTKKAADKKRGRDLPPTSAAGGGGGGGGGGCGGGGKRDKAAAVCGAMAEEAAKGSGDLDAGGWRKALPGFPPEVYSVLARMSEEVFNYELAAALVRCAPFSVTRPEWWPECALLNGPGLAAANRFLGSRFVASRLVPVCVCLCVRACMRACVCVCVCVVAGAYHPHACVALATDAR